MKRIIATAALGAVTGLSTAAAEPDRSSALQERPPAIDVGTLGSGAGTFLWPGAAAGEWRDLHSERPIYLAGEGGEGGKGRKRGRTVVIRERDYYPALVGVLLGGGLAALLSDLDRRYVTDAFERAEGYPGQPTPWVNPGTGHSGDVVFLPGERSGRACREYRSRVRIDGRIEEAWGVACRRPDGTWEVVG